MKREYYFAYGSNMDEAQMKLRCPNAVKVGTGLLLCYRFAIDSAKVATIIHDSVSRRPFPYVQGVVWSVTEEDIRKLDVYEGATRCFYRKECVEVFIKTKEGTFGEEALVYISNRAEWEKPSGTGSRYMDNIFVNAYLNNFNDEYLDILSRYTEKSAIPVPRGTVLDRYFTGLKEKSSAFSGSKTDDPSDDSRSNPFVIERRVPITVRPSKR